MKLCTPCSNGLHAFCNQMLWCECVCFAGEKSSTPQLADEPKNVPYPNEWPCRAHENACTIHCDTCELGHYYADKIAELSHVVESAKEAHTLLAKEGRFKLSFDRQQKVEDVLDEIMRLVNLAGDAWRCLDEALVSGSLVK